jgi:hypothetical protein
LSRRSIHLLLSLVATMVLGSVLAAGGTAAFRRFEASLRTGQEDLVPPDILHALGPLQSLLPADAPLLYVSADTDTWRCGLWQRFLHPRPVFCVRTSESSHSQLAAIRRTFDVKHAIGTAPPPADLSIVRVRSVSDRVWMGDLER